MKRRKHFEFYGLLILLLSNISCHSGEILKEVSTDTTAATKLAVSSINQDESQSINKNNNTKSQVTKLPPDPGKTETIKQVGNIVENNELPEDNSKELNKIDDLQSSFEESTNNKVSVSENQALKVEEDRPFQDTNNNQNDSDENSSAKFVTSEPSLATDSITVINLPSSSENKNESVVIEEQVEEKDVSDAVIPPELLAKPNKLPTSTPSTSESPNIDNVPNDSASELITEILTTTPAPSIEEQQQKNKTEPLSDTGEEIPSFNEWTQKQLADAEKRKVQNTSELPKVITNVKSSNLKLRSKNYASPDCGAKILAANPESQSVSSVLSSSRDEYALNSCNSPKIWFVMELCESIQIKQFELANFELFSSSPKDFNVSISDRFPTRDWKPIGIFQAKDERDIQTFPVQSDIFGKFIRVDLLSHWGSEHYCPISLVRIYGTSEYEVLETEDGHGVRHSEEDEDDDDDDLPVGQNVDAPNNLFGSARDAVINIVKKAAQVLVKTGDSKNKTEGNKPSDIGHSCNITSIAGEECADCSPHVLHLLVCKHKDLRKLLAIPYVSHCLQHQPLCHGASLQNDSYLAVMLSPDYITALCHLLYANNKPRSTTSVPNYENLTIGQSQDPFLLLQPSETTRTTCDKKDSNISTKTEDVSSLSSMPPLTSTITETQTDIASQIRPTGTLKESEISIESSKSVPVISTAIPEAPAPPETNVGSNENVTVVTNENPIIEEDSTEHEITNGVEWPTTTGEQIDTIIEDLKETTTAELEQQQITPAPIMTETENEVPNQVPSPSNPTQNNNPVVIPTSSSSSGSQQLGQQQKESIFVRLANRIKVLERNMSLSAQYLEELSKRYKRQVEEMQKAFERTLAAVGESSRQSTQRELAHAEQISSLEQRVAALAETTAALLAERDSFQYKLTVLSQFFIAGLLILHIAYSLINKCIPTIKSEPPAEAIVISTARRRSADEVTNLKHVKSLSTDEIGKYGSSRHKSSNNSFKDISKKRKRKHRRDILREINFTEFCAGLPTIKSHLLLHRPVLAKHALSSRLNTKSGAYRRFSTDSAPNIAKLDWNPMSYKSINDENKKAEDIEQCSMLESNTTINSEPTPTPIPILEVSVNSESVPSSPNQQQKKQTSLRKLVRKIF